METITTPPAGVVVKSDSTGRTRYTSQYKAEVLAAASHRSRARALDYRHRSMP